MSSYRLPDGTVAVLVSSDRADGLRAEAAALVDYLENHPRVTPDRVADMLFRTRSARRHRVLVMVRPQDDLRDALRSVRSGSAHQAVVSADRATGRRVGFVFPGQGGQRPGMGRLYYDAAPEYRTIVDECAAIHLDRFGHAQPLHYLLGDQGSYDDAVWEVQPAVMFHMLGLAAMWQAAGVRPAATIGHSQGELAAAVVAGAMTLREAVLVVTHRARLVDRIERGYTMAVLGMDRDECEALLARQSGWAELSVVNAPNIVVVSGEHAAVEGVVASATARGQFAKQIAVDYPAHTSLIVDLRADFETVLDEELGDAVFARTEIACYGGTLGATIDPELRQRDYWYWNLRNRVRFDRAVAAAVGDGIDTLIEISDHPALQLAMQDNLAGLSAERATRKPDVRVVGTSVRTATDLSEFARNLAAVAVHDANYPWDVLRVGTGDGAVTLPLRDFPHSQMDTKKLWAAYRSGRADLVVAAAAAAGSAKPRRLVESWIPLAQRSLAMPRRIALVDHTGRCGELTAALCAAAAEHGATATMVDAVRLAELASGAADLGETDVVVIVLPPLPDTDGPGAVADLTEFFGERAWSPVLAGLRPGGECWLLTAGGEAVTADDPAPQMVHAGAAAGFRCIGVEQPGVLFRHLDLPAEASQAQPAMIIGALHTVGEPELALREGTVYVKRLVPDVAPDRAGGEPAPDHVVIVGGTGQLGMQFCAYYADAGAARVTLLSRTGESDAVAAQLDRIRRGTDTEIAAVRCDVSDDEDVRRFAAACAGRPADVIVHTAINYVDLELAEITAASVEKAADAKILGLDAVLRSVPRTADCRVLLCSSIAATLGGRGQILYAVTNRVLDVTARRLRDQGVGCSSVQWGLWSVVGVLDDDGLARINGTGMIPMDPADALAVGLNGRPGDAVVAAADWAYLHEVFGAFGQGAVLSALLEPSEPPRPEATPIRQAPVSAGADAADGQLAERVRAELETVIGSDGTELLDSSVPLVALGLDSLQALEFRKRIKSELDRDIPVVEILGGASLDDVVLLMAEKTN
ncbi:nocobactin polyketide synthase NbtC [Nocardia sp. NPDC051787]|uniref:nocobactin polyketide synthase NbtC n=1 Tax=Nocardia sp. NPDC051787 TaxID=3155415 RepID=UPI00341FF039